MSKNLVIFYLIGILTTLSISFIAYFISIRYQFRRFGRFLFLLILLSIYLVFAQYFKYHSLHFYADFSHEAQILYNIITTGMPLCPNVEYLKPGTLNFFSVHFQPLFYLLALPLKLWPYGEAVIIINVVLILSAIIPLYKLAICYRNDKLFGLFMVTLLLWHLTFQYAVLYAVGILRLSIPIIFWMLYFWKKRNTTLYFIFVFIAV